MGGTARAPSDNVCGTHVDRAGALSGACLARSHIAGSSGRTQSLVAISGRSVLYTEGESYSNYLKKYVELNIAPYKSSLLRLHG